MSSLLDIEMFWYASFQLGEFNFVCIHKCPLYAHYSHANYVLIAFSDRDLLIDRRTGSHTRKPDRTIKLSKESAKLLPEIFHDDTAREGSSTCSICINEFKQGDRLKVLPHCHHIFHSKCILHWLTDCKNCCPLCMEEIVVDRSQNKIK